jgi:hypothetical protein
MTDATMTTAARGIADMPRALRTMAACGQARLTLPDAAHCIALAMVIERGLAPDPVVRAPTPARQPRHRRSLALVWMWLSGFAAGVGFTGLVYV